MTACFFQKDYKVAGIKTFSKSPFFLKYTYKGIAIGLSLEYEDIWKNS